MDMNDIKDHAITAKRYARAARKRLPEIVTVSALATAAVLYVKYDNLRAEKQRQTEFYKTHDVLTIAHDFLNDLVDTGEEFLFTKDDQDYYYLTTAHRFRD